MFVSVCRCRNAIGTVEGDEACAENALWYARETRKRKSMPNNVHHMLRRCHALRTPDAPVTKRKCLPSFEILYILSIVAVVIVSPSRLLCVSLQEVRIVSRHSHPTLLAVLTISHAEAAHARQRTAPLPRLRRGRQRQRTRRLHVHHVLREAESRELGLRERRGRVGDIFVLRNGRGHTATSVVVYVLPPFA